MSGLLLLAVFCKNNLRIQKARVVVFLCVQSTSLGYFLLCPAINREIKFASVYNESFGDFIGNYIGKLRDALLTSFIHFVGIKVLKLGEIHNN